MERESETWGDVKAALPTLEVEPGYRLSPYAEWPVGLLAEGWAFVECVQADGIVPPDRVWRYHGGYLVFLWFKGRVATGTVRVRLDVDRYSQAVFYTFDWARNANHARYDADVLRKWLA